MENFSVTMPEHDIRPLVQAPIESPMNMAHTFSRKADMLTKSKKYEAAIDCNRRAAEYLLQAMSVTKSPAMLEAMALQHKAYLSQIDKLHAKSQVLELVDRSAKTTATVSVATQTDDIHNQVETKHLTAVDEGTVCQILRENDNVMSQISQINEQNPDASVSSAANNGSFLGSIDSSDPSYLYKSVLLQKLTTTRADGCASVDAAACSFEEMVRMNEKLSSTVRGLIRELRASKLEKHRLEQRFGGSLSLVDKPSLEETLKFSSLDLPPLEHSYPELANFGPHS